MKKYVMPAEWEKHEATWLAWPHYEPHFPRKLEPVPYVYAEIIQAIIQSEKAYVCVNDEAMESTARKVLAEKKVDFTEDQVKFFHIPTNASWSRDHGPIFVKNDKQERIITDWDYNAWGGQWPYDLDDVVPQKVGKIFNIPVVQTHRVLEGGSIDVNGLGTVLTTEQCLLNPNRNGGLNKQQIEGFLEEFLGITNVLWLTEGIVGDDTSGHIDDIARFVNKNTVVCGLEKSRNDENYAALKKNFELLEKMKDQDGKPLNVVAMPMPAHVIHENRRLPASYANFIFTNNAILMPTYRCPEDEEVITLFSKLFPDKKIIGIDCTDLIWGLGSIHCSTQQMPL